MPRWYFVVTVTCLADSCEKSNSQPYSQRAQVATTAPAVEPEQPAEPEGERKLPRVGCRRCGARGTPSWRRAPWACATVAGSARRRKPVSPSSRGQQACASVAQQRGQQHARE